MWKQLIDFGRQLIALTANVRHHDEQIKALRADVTRINENLEALTRRVDRLTEALHRMSLERRHDREDAARQYENLVLRLDNALLRFERRLPPGTPPDELDTGQS